MSCTGSWSLKAKNRRLQIKIVPNAGSNPSLTELGMRIIDRATPPGPTVTRQFSASQLKAGVVEALVPAKRYELLLVTAPQGTQLVATLTLDDGNTLVNGAMCTRGQWPITGEWKLTTWMS
jgi:hypothetical protein